MEMVKNMTQQHKHDDDPMVGVLAAYDKAWERYVKAPGEREEARRELIKAREAYDKAWRGAFKPKAT